MPEGVERHSLDKVFMGQLPVSLRHNDEGKSERTTRVEVTGERHTPRRESASESECLTLDADS